MTLKIYKVFYPVVAPVKILQVSDLHIGREGLNTEDVFAQMEKIVKICKQNTVKNLIIAGDTFDKPGYSTDAVRNELKNIFNRLEEDSTQVYIISGNHDMPETINPFEYYYGNNVHTFFKDCFYKLSVSTNADMLFFPYFEKFSIEDVVKLNIKNLEKHTPLRLAFGHGTYFTPQAQMSFKHLKEEGEEPYYPFYHQYIKFLGIDYLGLGHFHNFCRWDIDNVCVCYSGSVEPFSFSQTGPRGAVLISIDEGVNVEQVEIDYQKRWGNVEIMLKEGNIQQVQNQAVHVKQENNFDKLRIILKGIKDDENKVRLLGVNLRQHGIELKDETVDISQIKKTYLGRRFVEEVYAKLEAGTERDFWQVVLQKGVEIIQEYL